jgi:mannose-6-phosphate isomerase-like protein (cupin superfamily)
MKTRVLLIAVLLPLTVRAPLARQGSSAAAQNLPLVQRIGHADPAKYRPSQAVHGGAGRLDFMAVLSANTQDTNFYFLHRGVIQPKSGIGAHFHNQCEEMFVILDGEAQFTIDGRTSVLKGPAGAPTRLGHSHAIYNATDTPVQWMNLNVTAAKGLYDAFNLDDPRVGVPLDPIPTFMTMRLDRALLRPMPGMHGGKGTVQYRRALASSVFLTAWSYVDHLLLPPGASTGPHSYPDIGEIYYVMNGDGAVTAGAETAPIHAGDAIPIRLNETQSFENTGSAPLELLVVGVARDPGKKMEAGAGAGRGGRGNVPPQRDLR